MDCVEVSPLRPCPVGFDRCGNLVWTYLCASAGANWHHRPLIGKPAGPPSSSRHLDAHRSASAAAKNRAENPHGADDERTASKKNRPAAPPPRPCPAMEALDQTHRQMMGVLTDLSQLLELLDREGVTPAARESAMGHLRVLRCACPPASCGRRAADLPGLLRSDDAELVQHVQRLQQDHGWLEEDWIELEPQLKAVSEGYSWYDLDSLRHGVGIFTELYHDHIAPRRVADLPRACEMQAAGRSRGATLFHAAAATGRRGCPQSGKAVVFFTVRSTRMEFDRSTPAGASAPAYGSVPGLRHPDS